MATDKKQIAPIFLPVDEWIPQWDITTAIAEAFHPDRRRASGVWLLTNKTLADGPAAGLPFRFTEDELHGLAAHADELPELSITMSDDEWRAFLNAFKGVFGTGSKWLPMKPDASSLYREYVEGCAIAESHQKALQKLVAEDKLPAVTAARVETSRLQADTLLFRPKVEEYLDKLGLTYTLRSAHVDHPGPELPKELAPIEWEESNSPAASPLDDAKPGRASTLRWTKARIAQLRAAVADKATTWSQREAMFGVSRQRMEQVLKQNDKSRERHGTEGTGAGAFGAIASTITKRR